MIRKTRSLPAAVVLASAFLLVACGDDTPDREGAGGQGGSDAGGGSGGGGGTPIEEIPDPKPWDCPGETAPMGDVDFTPCRDHFTGARMECASIDVPLNWCDPTDARLSFFVRRLVTTANESKGQLWMLQGGPGSPGDALVYVAPFFQDLGFDVYIPDYRGVGQSTALECALGGEGELSPFCLTALETKWGPGLEHFSTTAAARDIGHVIEAIRGADEPVYVWGDSYGTFVGNRYLTLFPEQPTAAILDGICPATGCDVRMDRSFDEVARNMLDYCGSDPFCSSRLSSDPQAWFAELLDAVERGHCDAALGEYTEMALVNVVSNAVIDPQLLAMGFSFAYRLDRCDPADQTILRNFVFGSRSQSNFGPGESSEYLYYHVLFSEFWDDVLTPAQARLEAEDLLLNRQTTEYMAEVREVWPWPVVRTDPGLMAWADTKVPLLLLNGTLDGQTPLSGLADLDEAFTAPHQQFVVVPWAGHVTLLSGASHQTGTNPCVATMVRSFLRDPTAPLDTGCTESIAAPDLAGSSYLARRVYGTDSLWDNVVTSAMSAAEAPAADAPTDAEVDALRERLLRPARTSW